MKLPYLKYYKTDRLYHLILGYWNNKEKNKEEISARFPTIEMTAEKIHPFIEEIGEISNRINKPTGRDLLVHLDRKEGKAKKLEPEVEKYFLELVGLK